MSDKFPVVNPIYFFNEEVSGHCLTFAHDENDGNLLCGTENGCVSVWDLKTLRSIPAAVCAGSSQCISVNVCDKKLITQDKTGLVKCWVKSEAWKEVFSIQLDYCGFCKISINSEQNLIACPFKNCAIQIYSLELKLISTFEPDETENKFGYVMGCKFIQYNEKYFLLVAYENGNLMLWDLETSMAISIVNLYKSPIFALDFDDCRSQGVCGTNSRKLSVFKVQESLSLVEIHVIRLKSAGVGCIRIHPNKEIIAVGCWGGMIRILSWTSFDLLSVLSFHSQGIEDICFSPKICEVLNSECVLFATSRDKKISLWNVSDIC